MPFGFGSHKPALEAKDIVQLQADPVPPVSKEVTERLSVDVVVIGAGISGLTAAYRLIQKGKTVMVMEARSRVGGRLLNYQLDDNISHTVEMGGQWVGGSQTAVQGLIAELGLETFLTYHKGNIVLRWMHMNHKIGADEKEPPAQEKEYAKLDELARTVPVDDPTSHPNAAEFDRQTFAQWIHKEVKNSDARDDLEMLCHTSLSADAEDISLLYLLWWLHACGGYHSAEDIENGAQEKRIIGGSARICDVLAEKIGKENIRLSTPVCSISIKDDDSVVCQGHGGELITCKRVIVAVPPHICHSSIHFEPALPPARHNLQETLSKFCNTPDAIKLQLVYPTPFWREKGFCGIGINGDFVSFDNSPPDASCGVLLCFVDSKPGHATDKLIEDAVHAMKKLYGDAAAHPQKAIVKDWADEKAYTATCVSVFPPGLMTRDGCFAALFTPVGPIHWAGVEASTTWPGYMDGGVRAAERAVEEAIAALDL